MLLCETEGPDAADARLPRLGRWRLAPGGPIEADIPGDATHAFVVADGRANPVDQVEAFKAWTAARAVEVARVICVVDCRLAERNRGLFAWYEACIHFSDVVLLNHREGVPNKWMGDFRREFEGRFYPCLFEHVKGGRVGNPALVLNPVALRISHVFDEEEWAGEDDPGEGDEGDEDEQGLEPEVDPYFERRSGGRRVREIPDIRKFLPGAGA